MRHLQVPQFVGPFEIVEKKSLVSYKLTLPPSLSKMHNSFHVSLLIKYVPYPSHVLGFFYFHILYPHANKVIPIRILSSRTRKLRSQEINECLVQWDKYFESYSTWKDEFFMIKKCIYLFD